MSQQGKMKTKRLLDFCK